MPKGIFLIHQFCKKLRLKWHLQKKVVFHQRSSRYHPVELMLAIIYALIAGIHRLNKTKILQGNGAFQQIILPAECISKQTLDHIIQKIEKMKPL